MPATTGHAPQRDEHQQRFNSAVDSLPIVRIPGIAGRWAWGE
jgi:hypothetical protein